MTDVKNKSSLSAATPIGVAADNELFFALPFVSSSVKLGYDVHKLQWLVCYRRCFLQIMLYKLLTYYRGITYINGHYDIDSGT